MKISWFRVFALTTVALVALARSAKAEDFLGQCLDDKTILKSKFQCMLSDGASSLVFTLIQGTHITVVGNGSFGNISKDVKVEKPEKLPPRLTSAGAVDESARFQGRTFFGSNLIRMSIPCHQNYYALVQLGKVADEFDENPSEHVARCKIQ